VYYSYTEILAGFIGEAIESVTAKLLKGCNYDLKRCNKKMK
jgi:ATP-dependent protease Clp ATPase subunit